MRIGELEVEAPVGLAILLEHRQRGLGRGLHGDRGHRGQVAQAHRIAQLAQERRGVPGPQALGAIAQDRLDLGRPGDQRLVALAQRRDVALDALEHLLLGIAPADALGIGPGEGLGLLRGGKGLVELKQRRAFGVLGLPRRTRVGEDGEDQLLQLGRRCEQRDRIAVALAHLAPVQAGQRGHVVVDQRLGQGEVLAPVDMVEALAEIAGHLDVLDLVAAHRDLMRVEEQDVGGHQHRIHEQSGGDAGIGVLAIGDVPVHRRLVGVRAVEDALAGHAGEQPGQLGNLGNVALPVEPHLVRFKPGGQPGGGDFQGRALGAGRVLRLDQAVQVGQEIEALGIGRPAGGDGRTHRPHVVAQVGRAGSGDAGQDTGGHAQWRQGNRPSSLTARVVAPEAAGWHKPPPELARRVLTDPRAAAPRVPGEGTSRNRHGGIRRTCAGEGAMPRSVHTGPAQWVGARGCGWAETRYRCFTRVEACSDRPQTFAQPPAPESRRRKDHNGPKPVVVNCPTQPRWISASSPDRAGKQ